MRGCGASGTPATWGLAGATRSVGMPSESVGREVRLGGTLRGVPSIPVLRDMDVTFRIVKELVSIFGAHGLFLAR
jgi:hypothetical protein